MTSPIQLVSGLAGAIGCDFRSSQNRLYFVEFGGKLSRLDLFSPATIAAQGTTVLKGTFTFDLDTGVQGGIGPGADIWWEQQTTVKRQMVPNGTARIINLGAVDFNAITAANLQPLPYSTTPIPGNDDNTNKLVTGDVFAVRTNQGNYAKVKVVVYGYDMKIQWVTYHLNTAYAVLGTGYQQPEDVKLSADNLHAFVTERTGDLLRVALNNANRAAATVVSAGMTAPQQIFLDESNMAAYVVEYAAPGRLLRINLTNGQQTVVLSNLDHAVGLLLSADRQFAFISEQTVGPDKGRLSRFQLNNGSRQPIATGLTAPFFLTWGDPTQNSILVPERDPANRVSIINLAHGDTHVVASGVPTRPSSVAVIAAGLMLICSDQVIEKIDFGAGIFQPAGPLLMGIGFVPFDKVTVAGEADTSVDPTYFFQVKNVPFAGTLPVMVNHLRAFDDGAVYYRVKVDGQVRMDSWTDEKWNGTQYVATTTAPLVVAGQPGFYPVHPLSELFLWMNPSLGSLMASTNLSNGLHSITLDFVNGTGVPIESSTPLKILVDNNNCTAMIASPLLNGAVANACGVFKYTAKNSDKVTLGLTASHPNGFATYAFSLFEGIAPVTLPPPTSGPVSALVSPITRTVGQLIGSCTVAGFAEYLYVAATAINGWNRQSQYDASAAAAFVLSE